VKAVAPGCRSQTPHRVQIPITSLMKTLDLGIGVIRTLILESELLTGN